MEKFGNPVKIQTKEVYKDAPGLGWEISEETIQEIKEINEAIRKSAMQLHLLMF